MEMCVKVVTRKLVDVFLNLPDPFPTGWEPEAHLRLQQRDGKWVQISGVKVASWQFKKIIGSL